MSLLRFVEKNAEAYLINFLLFNIVLWVFVQVIMRYIFSSSLPWSEEFVRWCFIWFIWVGVSYGFKTRRHICVTALIKALPLIIESAFLIRIPFLPLL
ncbi:TRAP transporter small permease [Pseudovibrio ascidiaceicola]|uniref:TRAP transporter small permease n=1 Tax=Pseudovibrio ascidiaceicola TaxID=285279 RepID=UPI003D35BEDE